MCLDYSKIIHKVDEIRKLWIQGNYEEAVNKIEEYRTGEFSLEFMFEEIDMLVMRGEFKKAEILLNNLRTSPELSTLISRYKSREFVVDYISGRKSYFEGRKSDMKHYMDKIDKYIEEIHVDDYLYYWKSFFLVFKGTFYLNANNMKRALRFYLEADSLLKPYEDKFYSAKFILIGIFNNVGRIHRDAGKFEEAIDWFEKGRKIGVENDIPWMMTFIYSQLGVTHSELGNYEKGIEYFNESINFQGHVNNPPFFQCVFNLRLFHLHLLIDNEKEANEIKQRIIKLLRENPEDMFYQQTDHLMAAMLMMRQNRRKSKVRAQIILEDLINDENLWFDYQSITRILLIHLLLEEFAEFEEDNILEEAKMFLTQLKQQAENMNNLLLLGEMAIIEAKISLLTKDIDNAFEILQEFKKMATSKKFLLLQTKIEDEVEHLMQIVTKWDELGAIESTMKQRLKQLKIDEYIKQLIKEKIVNKELDPI